MAASEIATLTGTVIQVAGVIQELGNNWYNASADWEDFPRKIARLQRKHDFWQKEFERSDMLSDRSLMETLGEAETSLKDEKAKLEGREARGGKGCRSKVSRTVFPAQVGLRIQLVIDAFDAIPGYLLIKTSPAFEPSEFRMACLMEFERSPSPSFRDDDRYVPLDAIPGNLQMEEDASLALFRWAPKVRGAEGMQGSGPAPRARYSLSFRDDERYVPLEVTESKVQEALNKTHGSQVVLLHGGPGKGKSALARHVALQYQKECKNTTGPFELVVFLECGPMTDILTWQFKLAQLLGENRGATALPQEEGQTSSDAVIQRRLSGLLKHQRILIVFDDVREPEFFQEMLNLCGAGVKCLVTSQNRELCRGLNLSQPAIEIQIEDFKDDFPRHFLSSHVGFPDKQIPAGHLQLLQSASSNITGDLKMLAARAITTLSYSENDVTTRQLVKFPGLLEHLVNILSQENSPDLRVKAATALRNLARTQCDEIRLRMMHCSGLLDKFFNSLSDDQFCAEISGWAYYVEALTYIDPARGNGVGLHSQLAYSKRAHANMILDLNKEALDDLNRVQEIKPGDVSTLRNRRTVRARLGNFEGALVDSNIIIERWCTGFDLQERGVLKRMMGNLPGALADLNKSLESDPDDYEVLKHRGFVTFLMKDESGAHFDAQMALKVRPNRVDASSYGRDCLGTTSVEFLDYKLR